MRRVSQVNEYLILEFDAWDRAQKPELWNYGIIPAASYCGMLGFDLGKMIRTDIETLEEAVKAAQDISEDLLTYICDYLCKFRDLAKNQDDLDSYCEKCRLGELAEPYQPLMPVPQNHEKEGQQK